MLHLEECSFTLKILRAVMCIEDTAVCWKAIWCIKSNIQCIESYRMYWKAIQCIEVKECIEGYKKAIKCIEGCAVSTVY